MDSDLEKLFTHLSLYENPTVNVELIGTITNFLQHSKWLANYIKANETLDLNILKFYSNTMNSRAFAMSYLNENRNVCRGNAGEVIKAMEKSNFSTAIWFCIHTALIYLKNNLDSFDKQVVANAKNMFGSYYAIAIHKEFNIHVINAEINMFLAYLVDNLSNINYEPLQYQVLWVLQRLMFYS